MFKVGDKVQFIGKRKKKKLTQWDGAARLLGLPDRVIEKEGYVSKVSREILDVSFTFGGGPSSIVAPYEVTYKIPKEFLKQFEIESNHPITRIFL